MQIEVDEILEIPYYTDTERYKKLKNKVYLMAKKKEPFHMPELTSSEYRYYSEMWFIFKRLIAKEITPEQATSENDAIYKKFVNEQTIYNQHAFDVIEWNEKIKKSESARVKIHKSKSINDLVDGVIECIESLTNDKTMRTKLESLKGKQT